MMLLLLLFCPSVLGGHMETVHSWTAIDYVFPSDDVRNEKLENGEYIPKNIVVLDTDTWYDWLTGVRKTFITMPKLKPGVPATIGMVTDQTRNGTTLLQPYPDWSWHQGDCDSINSVFRTHVDECGRIWILDSSMVDVFSGKKRTCPPQVLIFDLRTDKLIKRYRIPESNLDDRNLLLNIAVDTRTPDCSDAFAYIADAVANKLIVYDSSRDKSWRASGDWFAPNADKANFHTSGKDYHLFFGTFGLALGPMRTNGDRTLYFHSLASVEECWVTTSTLRDNELFKDPSGYSDSFHKFNATRSSQSAAEDMSDCGVLLFSLTRENAIGCWNSHLPFETENMDIVAQDDERLQFQSGLKIYGDTVWTMSSRFQNFYRNEVPDDEINYRVNTGRFSELIRNTKCDAAKYPYLERIYI